MTMAEKNNIRQIYDFVSFGRIYPEPTFNVRKASGTEWIQFGEKDDLPEYVESLLDKSADHAAICTQTIAYVQGNGLVEPTDARAKAMFENGDQDIVVKNTLNDIQQKLARDLVVHGACLLNVRWSRDGKRIADVNHVDVKKMRLDKPDEGYWISSDWSNVKKNIPEFHPKFSTTEGGSQLWYVTAPSARGTRYGMPAYWSARQAIDLQESMMKFNLKRVNHNFQVSAIISYDDTPTEEEKDEMTKALKNFTVGPDGEFTGGFLQTYGGGVTVTPFDSGSGPKDFEWISTYADQRIRGAWRVPNSGAIFGLSRGDNPQGFSQQDLEGEFELYSQSVVRPLQNVLLDIWNTIARINGISHRFEIDPYALFDGAKVKGAQADAAAPAVADAAPEATANVQATALNGAQVDSLVSIITQVNQGAISRATAKPLIQAAFPLLPVEQIDAMLSGIQTTTSNVNAPSPISIN